MNIEQEKQIQPTNKQTSKWWGNFQLEIGQMGFWQIGPSSFSIHRLKQEWRIIYNEGTDTFSNELVINVPLPSDEDDTATSLRRYMFQETHSNLSLTPVLVDRSVVVRPQTPFSIREGQEVTLYLTTPLWVRVEVEGMSFPLHEIPTLRLSDTWFGNDTLSGELCYAGKLAGRLSLEDIHKLPYRVISPLKVRNRSLKPLLIERVKLPLQYLSIYNSKDHLLWTQTVILTKEKDQTKLKLDKNPLDIEIGERISGPRQKLKDNLILRAFGRLRGKKIAEE